MHIELSVCGQRLRREPGPGIVADSRNYLTAHVAFLGTDWDGCQVWLNIDRDGAQNAYKLDEDGCVKAEKNIQLVAGQYEMSLLGLRGEVRIPTNKVPLTVMQSGADGGDPLPEIPQTAAEQIAMLAQEAADTARSVREDADAGDFNGAPGNNGVSAKHQWDGSVLTITSASGTSSADLRGPQGPQGQAGKDAPQDAVRYGAQALTDEEQETARGNIGAASAKELSHVKDDLAELSVKKTSSNLFNPDEITDGFTINSSGALVTNAGYSTTAFLECDGGKDLYCTTASTETDPRTSASFAGILFYDLNKNVIADSYASWKAVATSPSNAKYFRIAIQNIHIIDSFYAINYASTKEQVPPYEPYYSYSVVKADTELSATSEEPIQNRAVYAEFQKELAKQDKIDTEIKTINDCIEDNFVWVKPNNIFNKETVTIESNLTATGALVETSGYSVSDFIEVESGKTLYCNFKNSSNEMVNIHIVNAVFYGADKHTVISSKINYWQYTITVPQDAVYLRLSVQSAKVDTLCLYYDGYAEDYEAYFAPYSQSIDHDTVKTNVEYINQFAKNFRNTNYTKIEKSCHHVLRRPIVTIIADDGYAEDYTSLKSMVDAVHETYPEANIPCCIAIHHFCFNRPNGMTLEQALYSQNELGWEYCSHVDGTALATLETEKEIRECIVTAQKAYAKNGVRVNNLVYPQGSNDERVRRIAKEYYNCGATTATQYTGSDPKGVNTGIVGSFFLKRWALGALYSGHGEGAGTFEGDYKIAVDRAIANNGWLIFMLHPAMPEHDETQQAYFVDTVKYCLEKNIPIVTLQQGLDIFGNVLECGDFLGSTSAHPDQGFAISKNGEFSKNPFI